ncbi:MAG: adenylate/guanylate cyclase domain-containing protein, partial [Candidatus Promineifilaceae bacterium]|nr:adenylate/guanylate cyclase domain-containing protein [Candidatus Promineifilaceae bacterium]
MNNLVPHFIIDRHARKESSGRFAAAAVFVDVSGFSALTDQLMARGQHGAEVLAGVMGSIFEPLIDAVYGQRGFVTGFAGDAFTAVFPHADGANASPVFRALAAAVAIQREMQARPEQETAYGNFAVSAKVGVAGGDVIWGIVAAEDGQRATYYFQGTAIDGCAAAEGAAAPGDVVLDAVAFEAVRTVVTAEAVDGHYRLTAVAAPLPAPEPDRRPEMKAERLLPFVPQAVVRAGRTGEFRQVVNVFISLPTVRTEAQLDIFMRTVFKLQERYGGLLKQLDYGDKGAKLLLFWGAPVAHENDVQRALHFILDLQIQTAIPINGGITYQVAHAGTIGSSLRGEYTCYGKGVNLAARFMTGAPRGEIWIDEQVANRAGRHFEVEFEGEKQFKGFAEPQKVYVLFERTDVADAFFDGRLVGREAELARLTRFVAPIYEGRSPGMFVIWGDPGAGKSRLAHEFLTHHLQQGTATQVFLAQADEILRQSLNPFRYWLRRHFGQSEGLAESRNKRSFNRKLDQL